MDPLGALAKFALGWIHEGHLQEWIRLGLGFFATAWFSFFGTFAAVGGTLYFAYGAGPALVMALFAGVGMMVASTLVYWQRNKLSQKIPVIVPAKIFEAAEKALAEQGGTVSVESGKVERK